MLKLNRSTVYKVINHKLSNQAIDRLDLESRIINLFNEFDSIYGSPKLVKELKKGYNNVKLKYMLRTRSEPSKYKPGQHQSETKPYGDFIDT